MGKEREEVKTCPVCFRNYDQRLGRACSAGCDYAMGTPEDPAMVIIALLAWIVVLGICVFGVVSLIL